MWAQFESEVSRSTEKSKEYKWNHLKPTERTMCNNAELNELIYILFEVFRQKKFDVSMYFL